MPPLIQGLAFALPFLIVVGACTIYFSGYPERQARVRRWLSGNTMSSAPDVPAAPIGMANQSLDQSASTSLNGQTSAPGRHGLLVAPMVVSPDMDAEQTGLDMPRVSRYLTDDEFIIFLATQKLRDGKYRMSANDIVKAVKGDRTEVLAIVRQVRESPPAFPPLTEAQQQARQQLQLDQR